MGKITVYLAGPIAGATIKEGREKRSEIARSLSVRNIKPISPLRHKTEDTVYRPKEIVDRDKMDIRRSDAILCDYTRGDRAYIGTSMEIMYADMKEIPVFVVAGDWAKDHYWIQAHATKVFSNSEEAAEYILEFFH